MYRNTYTTRVISSDTITWYLCRLQERKVIKGYDKITNNKYTFIFLLPLLFQPYCK